MLHLGYINYLYYCQMIKTFQILKVTPILGYHLFILILILILLYHFHYFVILIDLYYPFHLKFDNLNYLHYFLNFEVKYNHVHPINHFELIINFCSLIYKVIQMFIKCIECSIMLKDNLIITTLHLTTSLFK